MQKRRKGIVAVMVPALLLTGCMRTSMNSLEWKLRESITTSNLQGVKEATRDKKLDLENMKVKIEVRGEDDKRALAQAISEKPLDVEMIQTLVDAGAKVNSKTGNYLCDIIRGAECPYSDRVEKVLKILLENGADPNQKDEKGYTAIDRWICESGIELRSANVTMVKDVWKMVDLFQKYGGEITANTLRLYLKNGGYVCGEELLKRLKENGTGAFEDLEYAINGENEKLLTYLEKNKPSSKQVILQAAAHCNVDVLKKMKEQGCDLGIKGSNRMTLLHIAASYNDADVVRFLAKEGGLEKKTEDGECTPFTMALIHANKPAVQVLKEMGATWQVSKEATEENDSWVQVCKWGDQKSVKMLLAEGFKPKDSECSLGYGVSNPQTLQALLEKKISYDVHYKEDGEKAFSGWEDLAYFNTELAYKIYKKDPDSKKLDNIYGEIYESVDRDLARKFMVETLDASDESAAKALECAVNLGDYNMVKKLIKIGVDVNQEISPDGDAESAGDEDESAVKHTVLHAAAECTSEDIAKYLVKHGADVNKKDGDGNTAYDIAKENQFFSDVDFLK